MSKPDHTAIPFLTDVATLVNETNVLLDALHRARAGQPLILDRALVQRVQSACAVVQLYYQEAADAEP